MIFVKQYGERRTCTNLAKHFVEQNFRDVEVLASVLGWKHGLHPKKIDWSGESWGKEYGRPLVSQISNLAAIKKAFRQNEIRYLICTKNPYAWCLSFMKRQSVSFRKGINQKYLKKILRIWSRKYANWLFLLEGCSMGFLFRHEDYLRRPKKLRDSLAEALSIEPLRRGNFSFPKRFDKNGQKPRGRKIFLEEKFDKDFYLREKFMDFYSEKDRQIFRENIDVAVVRKMGYTL